MVKRLIMLALWLAATPVLAQEFRSLARLDPSASAVREGWGGRVEMTLALTQAVPWRVTVADAPARLIVDFREVNWQGTDLGALAQSDAIASLRTGTLRPGWSRLVAELDGPYLVETAAMMTDPTEGTAKISVFLEPTDRDAFAKAAAAVDPSLWAAPHDIEAQGVRPRQTGDRALRVVLDPGHGGVDPGAERSGVRESDLMLTFARELKEILLRRGGFEVIMTRADDSFVSLNERVSVARAVQADVFLSLHADAIAEGRASGATIYVMSDKGARAASHRLTATLARDDLIAGVDLERQDDEVALLLMDLARRELSPRSAALADALVVGMGKATGRLHKRPRLEAEFVVLKAPDIPSALIEVGFMSDPQDLANLTKPAWRAKAALGIANALEEWAVSDATQALRLRQ